MIANSITPTGLTLPYWLTSGQTLAADQMVQSISVIEFTVNASTNALEFSQVKKVTTVQTVPAGKVWKIESIAKTASLSSSNGAVWSGAGTYSLTVPSCASYVCIEVWGAGGGGYDNTTSGSGGGGAYGQGCFSVTPGSTLSIVIGAGGIDGVPGADGGTTSVTGGGTGVNISASGGLSGTSSAGGAGGSTITATVAVAGGSGSFGTNKVGAQGGNAGGSPVSPGGFGGSGGNGVTGSAVAAGLGLSPGGGGGGGCAFNVAEPGGKGAPGKAIITW